MSVTSGSKLLARIGLVAGLAVGLAVASQSGAVAQPDNSTMAPVVTVTPSTGLHDGDTVTVSGSGLTPDTVYHVGQCAFVSADEFGCNLADALDVTSDASGTVTATLVVRGSFVAAVGPEGTPWGTVDCAESSCLAGLGDDTGLGGDVPITFE